MTQTQADVRRCGAAAVAVRRRRLLRRSALAHSVGRTDIDPHSTIAAAVAAFLESPAAHA